MSYVTIIWSVIASGSLLLAIMYGIVWILDRKSRAALAFSFESLSIVGSVIVELGMMYATTPVEWGEWARWAIDSRGRARHFMFGCRPARRS